jgi:hypothetical protein
MLVRDWDGGIFNLSCLEGLSASCELNFREWIIPNNPLPKSTIMNTQTLGKVIAIIDLLVAVYVFDWNDWNKIIISILLLLSGIGLFLQDSERKSYKELSTTLFGIAFIIAVLFLLKLIILGIFIR